jgi:adenylate cyclase
MRKYRQQFSVQSSQERLERLIEERLNPAADTSIIDTKIWDLFGETWTVMFTDLSGFSRHVEEFGIIHFLQIIHESDRLFLPIIDNYEGIFLKKDGDSLMVIFRNPDKAIHCSIEMQCRSIEYNKNRPPEEQILVCVGLGYGEMLRIDQDVYGKEVNSAAKLGEDTANAGEILVTEAIVKICKDNHSFTKLKEIPGIGNAFSLRYKKSIKHD